MYGRTGQGRGADKDADVGCFVCTERLLSTEDFDPKAWCAEHMPRSKQGIGFRSSSQHLCEAHIRLLNKGVGLRTDWGGHGSALGYHFNFSSVIMKQSEIWKLF